MSVESKTRRKDLPAVSVHIISNDKGQALPFFTDAVVINL